MDIEGDLARAWVRIQVDLPALKQEIAAAKAYLQRELSATVGKVKISPELARSAASAGRAAGSQAKAVKQTGVNADKTAVSIKRAELQVRSLAATMTKEFGKERVIAVRADVAQALRRMREIRKDPALTGTQKKILVDVELRGAKAAISQVEKVNNAVIQAKRKEHDTLLEEAARHGRELIKQERKDAAEAAKARSAALREQQKQVDARIRPGRSTALGLRSSAAGVTGRFGKEATVEVRADISQALKEIRRLTDDKSLSADQRKIKIDAVVSGAKTRIREVETELKGLQQFANKPVISRLRIQENIEKIRVRATSLQREFGKGATARYRAEAAQAIRQLRILDGITDQIPPRLEIKVKAELANAQRRLAGLDKDLNRVFRPRVIRPQVARPRQLGGLGMSAVYGTQNALRGFGPVGRAGANVLGAGANFARLGSGTVALGGAGMALGGTALAAGAVAGGVGVAGAAGLGKVAVDGSKSLAQVEKYRTNLEIILKDQAKANKLFAELEELDIKLPVRLDTLAESAQKLAGAGFDPDKIARTVETIANAGSISVDGLNEGVNRITRALTQIKSKSRIEIEDLNQIAELGVPIKQIIREQFNVDAEQLGEKVRSGLVTIDDAIEGILQGFDNRFGGALAKQGNTMLGLIDQARDRYNAFARDASEPLFDTLRNSFAEFLMMIDEGELKGIGESIAFGLDLAALSLQGLKAGLSEVIDLAAAAAAANPVGMAVGGTIGGLGSTIVESATGATPEALAGTVAGVVRAGVDANNTAAERAIAERREAAKRAEEEARKRAEANRTPEQKAADAAKQLEQEFSTALTGALTRINNANETNFAPEDFTRKQQEKLVADFSAQSRGESRAAEALRNRQQGHLNEVGSMIGFEGRSLGAIEGAASGLLTAFQDKFANPAAALLGTIVDQSGLGAAGSALGGKLTDPKTAFDELSKAAKAALDEAIAGADPETARILKDAIINLEGQTDDKGRLRTKLGFEIPDRPVGRTERLGVGSLNAALQGRIEAARQEEYAKKTAAATEALNGKFDTLVTAANNIGRQLGRTFTATIGP